MIKESYYYYYQMTTCVEKKNNWRLYLTGNKTQVQIEKKKGKYGIEYSLLSASDGPCPNGWGPTLTMEFLKSKYREPISCITIALQFVESAIVNCFHREQIIIIIIIIYFAHECIAKVYYSESTDSNRLAGCSRGAASNVR